MSKFIFLSINLINDHVMAPDKKKNRKINARLLEHEIFLMTNSYQKVQKTGGLNAWLPDKAYWGPWCLNKLYISDIGFFAIGYFLQLMLFLQISIVLGPAPRSPPPPPFLRARASSSRVLMLLPLSTISENLSVNSRKIIVSCSQTHNLYSFHRVNYL